MTKHAISALDPTHVSPKVTAGTAVGVGLTVLAGAVAVFLAAIPQDAFEGLGVWAVPASLGVGTIATQITAYLKGDPARSPSLYQTASGVHTSLENADADEAGLETHIHEDLEDDPDPGTAAGGIDPPETYLVPPGEQPVTEPVADVDPTPADAELDEFAKALQAELERRGRA